MVLQTDHIARSHLTRLKSALTRPPPSSYGFLDPWSSFTRWRLPRYKGLLYCPRQSGSPTGHPRSHTTIVWLDTLASPNAQEHPSQSIGPEWLPFVTTTSLVPWSAVAASPSITSPMAPTRFLRSANDLGLNLDGLQLRGYPCQAVHDTILVIVCHLTR